MILYHGSNMEIENIRLDKCRKYKDFGQGFYLTTLKEQAINMAKRTVMREETGIATITIFECDENKFDTLNIKKFDGVCEDWALMIINNRNISFSEHSNLFSNHDNKYDIVIRSYRK